MKILFFKLLTCLYEEAALCNDGIVGRFGGVTIDINISRGDCSRLSIGYNTEYTASY